MDNYLLNRFSISRSFLKSSPTLAASALVCLSVFSSVGVAGQSEGAKKIYVGGSVGMTRLDTEFAKPQQEVVDGALVTGSIFAGIDISPRITLEASASNTDEADVKNNFLLVGDVGYSDYSISALGYLYQPASSGSGIDRNGISVFSRVGAGYKVIDSELATRDSDKAHFILGLGSEYGWKNGVATRTEISLLDDDAKQLNFSLLKRFDLENAPTRVSATPRPAGQSGLWGDRLFISLPTIYFPDDDPRSPITRQEQKRLDQLAQQLLRNPRIEVEVRGHSEVMGSLRDALIMSRRRAITVSRYLQSKGVRGNRMHIRSYGSSKPLKTGFLNHSNSSKAVKINNRRVEIEVFGG